MGIAELFILITAIIFTGVGYYFARQQSGQIIEYTIDTLIVNGYLSAYDKDGETHLVKIKDIHENNIQDG